MTDFNKNKIPKMKNQEELKNNTKNNRGDIIQNENININNQPIDNNIPENIHKGQILEINDLIGEKCDLD